MTVQSVVRERVVYSVGQNPLIAPFEVHQKNDLNIDWGAAVEMKMTSTLAALHS